MKSAEEWCEEMFHKGNWVVADTMTIRGIQADALRHAAELARLYGGGGRAGDISTPFMDGARHVAMVINAEADRIEKGNQTKNEP